MRARRGFVLVAVLVIVGCAVLIATGIVFLVRGEVAGTVNATETLRMRAASWSAVQAVAARLAAQRDRVIQGAAPTMEPTLTLWDSSDETALARLLPVGSDGERIIAEASRVDLRMVTPDELLATGAVPEELVTRTIRARDALGGGAIQPEALLAVGANSLAAQDLYGPLDEIQLALDEDEDVRSGAALERLLTEGTPPRGLADLLTGFAEEPPLTSAGELRLALDGAWDDARRSAVDALLGAGAATLLETAAKSSTDASVLFTAWRAKHPEPRDWVAFLDGTEPTNNSVLLGRLDVMRASPAALRSLPGVDAERAARIVRERDALPDDARRTGVWLVERGILSADEFAAIVGRITTRSFFWRVRIAVTFGAPGLAETKQDESGRVAVFDAIIDLSGAVPRIAMLRDVSSLETVARLAGDEAEPDADSAQDQSDASVPSDLDVPPEPAAVAETPEQTPGPTEAATESDHTSKATRGTGRWRRTREAAE